MTRSPVFITETVQYILRHVHPDLKRSIRRALDELAHHPSKGKPLQEELAGLWSFRVSHYRIIYRMDEAGITIVFSWIASHGL